MKHVLSRITRPMAVLSVLAFWAAAPLSGQGNKFGIEPKKSSGLSTAGSLGSALKGHEDLHEFTYYVIENRKKVKKKIWLKIDSKTKVLRDVRATLAHFEAGESVKLFGKPVERESSSRQGYSAEPQRLIQATRLLIGGEEVSVNMEFTDPKDKEFKWCDAKVESAGKALTVNYGGSTYKVTLDRRPTIIKRIEGKMSRDVKRSARLVVSAKILEGEKSPDAKKDYPIYKAEILVVMERTYEKSYVALVGP